MKDTPIDGILSRDVVCVPLDEPVHAVVRTLLERSFSCVLVGQDRQVFGVISERDIVELFHAGLQGATPPQHASEVMSWPAVTISEKGSLIEALSTCRAHKIRRLPVVDDDGLLVGLVTQGHLTDAYFQLFEAHDARVEEAIAARTQALLESNDRLQANTLTDPLLRIGNRRAMERDLSHTHYLNSRHRRPYSVLLIDLDLFRSYNDLYGREAGDRALKRVADSARASLRRSDRVYRYSGEELLVLLPETRLDGAFQAAQSIVDRVASLEIAHIEAPPKILTISVGCSDNQTGDAEPRRWQDVVQIADESLYRAKKCGRNQSAARFL